LNPVLVGDRRLRRESHRWPLRRILGFAAGAGGVACTACWICSLGTAFIKTRNLPLILLLPLAAIGLLERFGLKEHAQASIAKIRSATTGRLLIVYLAGARTEPPPSA
jgi:uncharacterized membrane protein